MVRFKKLYVDLVTSDLTVLIAYLTRTDLFGIHILQAAIELYFPDGKRESYRAKVARNRTADPDDLKASPIYFHLPRGPLALEVDEIHGAWSPDSGPITPGMTWSVAAARSRVTVRWPKNPHRRQLVGEGYADHITIHHFLRHFEIEQVDWGRIHLAGSTIVFNSVRFKEGSKWEQVGVWSDSVGFQTFDRFEIINRGETTHIRFPKGEIIATIDRVLHEGRAIDAERFPNAMERTAVRLSTGPLWEMRFVSRVEGDLYGSHVKGSMLHERVSSKRLIRAHSSDVQMEKLTIAS